MQSNPQHLRDCSALGHRGRFFARLAGPERGCGSIASEKMIIFLTAFPAGFDAVLGGVV